jgi:hypothetical protein
MAVISGPGLDRIDLLVAVAASTTQIWLRRKYVKTEGIGGLALFGGETAHC